MKDQDNYEVVYGELLEQVGTIDLESHVTSLGGFMEGERPWMPFLGSVFEVTRKGILDQEGQVPNVAIRIVICHYLLQSGEGDQTGEFVSYRDFKDSAFFIAYVQANSEEKLARHFSGSLARLERAAQGLGGKPHENFQAGDLCYDLQALPNIPLLLVFHDGDDEFPASCKLLFDLSAPIWLDAECMAVLATIVADTLIKKDREYTDNS